MVDLNCDMGEGAGNDDRLMEHITSANIACGFHAGDASTMRRTVAQALEKNIAVGAHPGFPDREGFGRGLLDVAPEEAYDFVVYQVGALQGFATALGGRLSHVKPHGALYNAAAVDRSLADAIASAVRDVDDALILFGLAGGHLLAAAEAAGLQGASEVFADRRYEAGGTLVSRDRAEALITDHDEAVAQAIRLVSEGKVRAIDGSDVAVRADTICIHGDGPEAVTVARAIRERFDSEGIELAAPQRRRS